MGLIGWQGKVIAAVVLFAALSWFAYNYHDRGERIDELELRLSTVKEANESNLTTITELRDALQKWRALIPSPNDLQQLINQANTNAVEVNKLRGVIARGIKRDQDLPDCIKLLSISLQRTCPSVTSGLRDLARGKDGDGGSPRAGGEAVAAGDHPRL